VVVSADLPCDDPAAGCDAYANVVVDALPRFDTDVVVVGHSLAGLTIPLVAARRSVRRLVFLCAFIPRREGRQYTTPHGEPCPLAAWPKVPSSYVLARQDGAVGADWARRAAQERLGVEADEIDGGHSPFSLPPQRARAVARRHRAAIAPHPRPRILLVRPGHLIALPHSGTDEFQARGELRPPGHLQNHV